MFDERGRMVLAIPAERNPASATYDRSKDTGIGLISDRAYQLPLDRGSRARARRCTRRMNWCRSSSTRRRPSASGCWATRSTSPRDAGPRARAETNLIIGMRSATIECMPDQTLILLAKEIRGKTLKLLRHIF